MASQKDRQAQAQETAQENALAAPAESQVGAHDSEEMGMLNQKRAVVCRRCGIGFLVTPNYRDLVKRWGARVIVPLLCVRCFRETGPLPKQQGTVKWFDRRKHYGFIVSEQGQELFVHQNQLFGVNGDGPHEGQTARFHVHYAAKGPEALNVELVEA
jgi:CspA family cold shock protein